MVCAAGNIEHKKLVEMVEKECLTFKKKHLFETSKQKYTGGYKIEKKDIEQVHVTLGFNSSDYYSDDYYPAMVLANILGGETSSRLFQEIREKELVFIQFTLLQILTQIAVYLGFMLAQLEELKEMIPIVCEEIKKLVNEKATEKELNRAKTQFKAGMLMTLESSSATSEVLARQMLLFNRVIPTEEIVENIEK